MKTKKDHDFNYFNDEWNVETDYQDSWTDQRTKKKESGALEDW